MINLFFFLKFKSQLRKTRPDIIRQIDESLIRAIMDAGGKITGERFVISAVFNEDTIGFWLDMFILIENLKNTIEASSEFFGYSLVIGARQPDSPELLCRFLACHSGVFVDKKAAQNLLPYALFEKPSKWMEKIKKQKYNCSSYYRIKELKTFKISAGNDMDFQNEITGILNREQGKNVLILGASYNQLRSELYSYCRKLNGDFPALTICFETTGLGCLIDIWSLAIRDLESPPYALPGGKEEIDSLWEFLFRERIRDEVSEYTIHCVKRFLILIFEFYLDAAHLKNQTPFLMLENIHLANKEILCLLFDTLAELKHENRKKLLLFGTGDENISTDRQKQCKHVFAHIIKPNSLKVDIIYFPKLSADLWEIIYAISLFNLYFSPEFFQRLFEEDKKNPVMISRAFSILYSLGIIDNLREPRIIKRHFEEYACKILDGKTGRVNTMVYGRLLNWAVRRNINPCFRLLMIISGLGGSKQIDDLLLLKSFYSDIVNNTTLAIQTAMNNGQFEELVTQKASAIRQIFKTSSALNSGCRNEIEKVFSNLQQDNVLQTGDAYPVFKSQIIVNYCSYFLGCNNEKDAALKAKEAIILGQSKNPFCLSQGYRLYSLVCLSKKQVNETIEYLGFAIANAEKNGNYHELAISAYYSAAAHFLYGDLFKAAHFTGKSIKQSLLAGRPDWADRSRFLEGRIKFELGYYKDALEIFETMCKQPYGSMTCEKENLLTAWIYRSKIYFEDPNTQKPRQANYDADLFEIEAAYLAGDYEKAVKLSTSCANNFTKENFLYTEKADWSSGFAQCEHLYFTNGEIQSRILSLFNSLSLCRLSSKQCEEAIHNISQLLRDDRLCEMDPWDAFYFYAKYRILEQSGASLVDMSTAVSMAFKRLQRRACHIENVETRHQYLNGPRWNRELCLAAKEFKLI
jgi:hypothetical protein